MSSCMGVMDRHGTQRKSNPRYTASSDAGELGVNIMAKKAVQEARILKICEEINTLLTVNESGAWKAGDLLVELSAIKVGGKSLTLKQLREQYLPKFTIAYLSQLRSTAQALPPSKRKKHLKKGVTWYECEIARRSRNHCIKANVATKEDPLDEYITFISRNKSRSLNPKQLMKKKIDSATDENRKSRALQVEQLKKEYPNWLSNCHHSSCLDVLEEIEDDSLDVVYADPPYGAFYKTPNGKFAEPESKGLETSCDSSTRQEALELTLGIIEQAARVLKPNGKLVLFQASTEPDRPEIISLLKELGLETIFPMYWKKSQPQPSDFKIPFSHETERILIAGRSRKAFQGLYNGKGRTDVIDDSVIANALQYDLEYEQRPISRDFYREVQRGERSYGDRHFFEKPVDICKFLLEKLTFVDDTVIDVCGCTGSMIEACIDLDRRWIYCESNETNYNLGVTRIGEVMERVAGIKTDDDASASA